MGRPMPGMAASLAGGLLWAWATPLTLTLRPAWNSPAGCSAAAASAAPDRALAGHSPSLLGRRTNVSSGSPALIPMYLQVHKAGGLCYKHTSMRPFTKAPFVDLRLQACHCNHPQAGAWCAV